MDSVVDPPDLAAYEDEALRPPWGQLGRSATLGVVSLFAKFVLRVLNSTTVDGMDAFQEHVMQRPQGQGLVTVSNHTRRVLPRQAAGGSLRSAAQAPPSPACAASP
jgi:monolysocardiolipin acyltransferase